MSELAATYTTNGHHDLAQAALLERIAALEYALDSPEWRVLTTHSDQEFSRQGLRQITQLCRISYLKNPLVKRGVQVKRNYVWGQGWTIHAEQPEIQAVIDGFLYDAKNDDVFGSHEARMQLEVELQTDGNLFFCFFPNTTTGFVRLRTIPFDQIEDVVSNPDDHKEPWYYLRHWVENRLDAGGAWETVNRSAYYPDWRYTPSAKPKSIGEWPVFWDKPVYHVKAAGFTNWKFSVSEIYDALDWARAYKSFLEDWATIVRAYRKFAFQLTAPTNRAVGAVRDRLSHSSVEHTTPVPNGVGGPPLTGSTFVATEGYNLQAVKTSGATVSAEDGRRILLMVAASFGLPETFFGDASVGSLATAQSLDRPTELMMQNRQQLWRDVTLNIVNFVQLWAVKAPQGALRSLGHIEPLVEDGQIVEQLVWNEGVNDDVAVAFPPLVEQDVPQMVAATVQAATLGAPGTLAGTIDLETLSRILLTTLGIADADEIVERLFGDENVETLGPRPVAEALMIEAVKELRDAILRESAR